MTYPRSYTRLFSLLTLAATLVIAPRVADAADCDPPQVLIVLDKSSSMVNSALPGDPSKWDVAVGAIQQVVNQYEGSIDFGLMIFPEPNQCAPGNVVVDMAPNNAAAVISALGSAPPNAGNYTPMAQSLGVAATHGPLLSPTRESYVLLITDGWQWCDPYDPATRFLPVQRVTDLANAGVSTYVVGFGDGVDALTLNRSAKAGGTAPVGCDETSTDPTSPSNCYLYADNAISLQAALSSIAITLTGEVCDGVDNDCNGLVDDGLTRACSSACGSGTETCTNGLWGGCDAPLPQTEQCDGTIDEDCDGVVDEGCNCTPGDQRACGITGGECLQGVQECIAGQWSDCSGSVDPQPESCDGLDNDCDGLVDEDLTRSCETACGQGEEICVDGTWEGCTSPLPSGEICDALDNDCDGEVDEGAGLCGVGALCIRGACYTQGGTPDGGTGNTNNDNGNGGANATAREACQCSSSNPADHAPLAILLAGFFFFQLRRRRRA